MSKLAEKIMHALYDADILETEFMAETVALIDEKLSGVREAIKDAMGDRDYDKNLFDFTNIWKSLKVEDD